MLFEVARSSKLEFLKQFLGRKTYIVDILGCMSLIMS